MNKCVFLGVLLCAGVASAQPGQSSEIYIQDASVFVFGESDLVEVNVAGFNRTQAPQAVRLYLEKTEGEWDYVEVDQATVPVGAYFKSLYCWCGPNFAIENRQSYSVVVSIFEGGISVDSDLGEAVE